MGSPVSTTNVSALLFGNKSGKKPQLLKKSLGEYYFDKFEDRIEPLKKPYESIYYAPASEFADLRHELACLDNHLVKARFNWGEERKKLSERWDAAIEKHKLVQENIPKFNGYYKDSFAKRERALGQHERELHQCKKKERKLRRLHKEKNALDKIKWEQDSRLDKFSTFKTYLDKVKEASQGEYGDLREIIDRYAVLAEARSSLMNRTDSTRETVARRSKALERDVLMKTNEVLAYRNFLSELVDYQQTLHNQVLRLEDNLLRIKTTAAQRTLIIGQIKMAIRNLYLQVCKHMHRNARITPEDTLGQLVDIRISVREMYKLAKDIKHMLKVAYVTAESEAQAREKQRRKVEERQKKIDKLTNARIMDPRELFGLPRKEGKVPVEGMIGERKFSIGGGGDAGGLGMSFKKA
ncbi:unnamed protein product [Orchesella dallaii]|uniref:DUF4200 domain-containing protein n=1 Tax=Orchesella dallaii TaxID=48710 RepID=A0ABP1PHI2_9HEXA